MGAINVLIIMRLSNTTCMFASRKRQRLRLELSEGQDLARVRIEGEL